MPRNRSEIERPQKRWVLHPHWGWANLSLEKTETGWRTRLTGFGDGQELHLDRQLLIDHVAYDEALTRFTNFPKRFLYDVGSSLDPEAFDPEDRRHRGFIGERFFQPEPDAFE